MKPMRQPAVAPERARMVSTLGNMMETAKLEKMRPPVIPRNILLVM